MKSVDLVFIGTQLGQRQVQEWYNYGGGDSRPGLGSLITVTTNRVKVERYLKGTGGKHVVVREGKFRGSGRHLIMADRFGDGPLYGFCGTRSIDDLDEAEVEELLDKVRALVPPQSEEPVLMATEEFAPPLPIWATVAGGLGALALAGALFASRWRPA